MSSSNAENIATAANQDTHRIAAEEAAEDVIINIALGQGVWKKPTMSCPTGNGDRNF